MYRRILVGFDDSGHSRLALEHAVGLAQATNGKLTVLSVAPEPSAWALGGGTAMPIDLNQLREDTERFARTQLDEAVDRLPGDISIQKDRQDRLPSPSDSRRAEEWRLRPRGRRLARPGRDQLIGAGQRQPACAAGEPGSRARDSRREGPEALANVGWGHRPRPKPIGDMR